MKSPIRFANKCTWIILKLLKNKQWRIIIAPNSGYRTTCQLVKRY